MKIERSTDWNNLETALFKKARGLTYGDQIHKMIGNIGSKVTELSRAEVLARRGQKQLAATLLEQVNNDIELVEEYLLVAALLG